MPIERIFGILSGLLLDLVIEGQVPPLVIAPIPETLELEALQAAVLALLVIIHELEHVVSVCGRVAVGLDIAQKDQVNRRALLFQ